MNNRQSRLFPFRGVGLNSILFAINIDNKDLNGQSKFAPTVSDLLKESTQNVTSLLKESTQGVSSLFREITASSAVSILSRAEQETDPLPVVSKHVSAGERGWGHGGLGGDEKKAPREVKSDTLVFSAHVCVCLSYSYSLRKGAERLPGT